MNIKRYLYISAWGLIAFHALTESYMLVWLCWKESAAIRVNWFLSKDGTPNQSPLWYIKDFTTNLLWCYTYFDYALTAYKTSKKKFIVIAIFFFYHCLDAGMYIYNFGNFRWFYVALLAIDAIAITVLFLPIKEKGKIISME